MPNSHLNQLPTLALSFNDLVSMRSIIRAYITYTRRVSQPTRERDEQMHVLESLYLRLTNMPVNVTDVALLLSVAEITALDAALAGFCAFVRHKVPPPHKNAMRPCKMSSGCARYWRECFSFVSVYYACVGTRVIASVPFASAHRPIMGMREYIYDDIYSVCPHAITFFITKMR